MSFSPIRLSYIQLLFALRCPLRVFTNKTLSFLFVSNHICLMVPIQDFYLPLTNLISTYQGLMQRLFFYFRWWGWFWALRWEAEWIHKRLLPQYTTIWIFGFVFGWTEPNIRAAYVSCRNKNQVKRSSDNLFLFFFVFFEKSRTKHNQEIPLNQPLKYHAQT